MIALRDAFYAQHGWLFKRNNNTYRFPDCDCRLYLAARHANHRAYGGPMDLENLLTLCPRHHALLHVHGWSVFIGRDETDVCGIGWTAAATWRRRCLPDPRSSDQRFG